MRKLIIAVAIATLSIYAEAKGGHGPRGGGHSGGHSNGHSSAGHYHSSHATTGTGAKQAHEHVSGYIRKNGKHVGAYDRSTRDSTKANNWSTKGNMNPLTGKRGNK